MEDNKIIKRSEELGEEIKKIKEEEKIALAALHASPEYIRKINAECFADIKKSFQQADSTGNKLLQELERAAEGRIYLDQLKNDELNTLIAEEQNQKLKDLIEKIKAISQKKSADDFEERNLKEELKEIHQKLDKFIDYINPKGSNIRSILKDEKRNIQNNKYTDFENWKKESSGVFANSLAAYYENIDPEANTSGLKKPIYQYPEPKNIKDFFTHKLGLAAGNTSLSSPDGNSDNIQKIQAPSVSQEAKESFSERKNQPQQVDGGGGVQKVSLAVKPEIDKPVALVVDNPTSSEGLNIRVESATELPSKNDSINQSEIKLLYFKVVNEALKTQLNATISLLHTHVFDIADALGFYNSSNKLNDVVKYFEDALGATGLCDNVHKVRKETDLQKKVLIQQGSNGVFKLIDDILVGEKSKILSEEVSSVDTKGIGVLNQINNGVGEEVSKIKGFLSKDFSNALRATLSYLSDVIEPKTNYNTELLNHISQNLKDGKMPEDVFNEANLDHFKTVFKYYKGDIQNILNSDLNTKFEGKFKAIKGVTFEEIEETIVNTFLGKETLTKQQNQFAGPNALSFKEILEFIEDSNLKTGFAIYDGQKDLISQLSVATKRLNEQHEMLGRTEGSFENLLNVLEVISEIKKNENKFGEYLQDYAGDGKINFNGKEVSLGYREIREAVGQAIDASEQYTDKGEATAFNKLLSGFEDVTLARYYDSLYALDRQSATLYGKISTFIAEEKQDKSGNVFYEIALNPKALFKSPEEMKDLLERVRDSLINSPYSENQKVSIVTGDRKEPIIQVYNPSEENLKRINREKFKLKKFIENHLITDEKTIKAEVAPSGELLISFDSNTSHKDVKDDFVIAMGNRFPNHKDEIKLSFEGKNTIRVKFNDDFSKEFPGKLADYINNLSSDITSAREGFENDFVNRFSKLCNTQKKDFGNNFDLKYPSNYNKTKPDSRSGLYEIKFKNSGQFNQEGYESFIKDLSNLLKTQCGGAEVIQNKSDIFIKDIPLGIHKAISDSLTKQVEI